MENIPKELLHNGRLCCVLRTDIQCIYYCAHQERIRQFPTKTYLARRCLYEDNLHDGTKVKSSSGDFLVTSIFLDNALDRDKKTTKKKTNPTS